MRFPIIKDREFFIIFHKFCVVKFPLVILRNILRDIKKKFLKGHRFVDKSLFFRITSDEPRTTCHTTLLLRFYLQFFK